MKKIKKLTEEQKAQLSVYREKWLEIGLSCGPCDFEKAKKAAHKAYRAADLKPPKQIILTNSPISGAVASAMYKAGRLDEFKDLPYPQVLEQTKEGELSSDDVSAQIYGSHEWWLSFYDYFISCLKVPGCEKILGLIELAKCCGWWTPYEDIAILQHRHSILKRDPEGRLHCENGKCIEYRDGWGFSAWHGTVVPNEWVAGKPPSPAEALTWNNIEQRRAACEIVGWDKVLDGVNKKIIDKNKDDQIGTLYEVELPDAGPQKFLSVICGTGRRFAIPVPPDAGTALEANAMTYGLTAKQLLKLEVRT
jgi:hypothetical protein